MFNCSVGFKVDKYSTSMKEFAKYTGQKFSYGADIHRSLKNEIKTGIPVPTRLNRMGDNGDISSNQKFV